MAHTTLILGAGSAQLDAIARCRKLGQRVLAVGSSCHEAARSWLHGFTPIDITNRAEVLAHARDNAAEVIYSVGSDLAMPTVAAVCRELGRTCLAQQRTAELMLDKGRFRQWLHTQGIDGLPFQTASAPQELHGWRCFPAVIKPVDSQGQRGVVLVNDRDALRLAFDVSVASSRVGRAIVERFVPGEELSLLAFMYRERLLHGFLVDRLAAGRAAFGVAAGHRFPSRASASVCEQAMALVTRVAFGLGIRDGPVYLQLKHDGDRVTLIEAAPRLDGCHLWRLIAMKTGVNLLEQSFRLLEGRALEPEPSRERMRESLTLNFNLQPPGEAFRPAARLPRETLFSQSYYSAGQIVRPVNGRLEKSGYSISQVAGESQVTLA